MAQFQKKGFTLIELIAVIVIILILSAVAYIRLGDTRTAALTANVQRLEASFSRSAAELEARGRSLGSVAVVASTGALIESAASNPDYMGLRTSTYRLSAPEEPDLVKVNLFLSSFNTVLASANLGSVGSLDVDIISRFNVDVVLAHETVSFPNVSSCELTHIFLKFSLP